ncbi:zinc finger CCCH domain-containing protein 5 isoform X2 [Canna indica]|uniref:Zinc finger CCCH domain-containing protein 5 isoform X2 n=1 Tax=Canna indica TaxID=4628 RepID=A0AAQ3KGZ4_9LILI|nr:zinc finger CCCH domain-containing protein 5 isoform X2 [Canna indica]
MLISVECQFLQLKKALKVVRSHASRAHLQLNFSSSSPFDHAAHLCGMPISPAQFLRVDFSFSSSTFPFYAESIRRARDPRNPLSCDYSRQPAPCPQPLTRAIQMVILLRFMFRQTHSLLEIIAWGKKLSNEDDNRPTSNPLPPQSVAFASYMDASSVSAQEALERVAQEVPNFGTEQDKAHCPFHLKTGFVVLGQDVVEFIFIPTNLAHCS